jgi:hypothetical protein
LTRLDFLGPRHFASKTADYEGWIPLDFLGFSRPNRDFSKGYEENSLKIFREAFAVVVEAA